MLPKAVAGGLIAVLKPLSSGKRVSADAMKPSSKTRWLDRATVSPSARFLEISTNALSLHAVSFTMAGERPDLRASKAMIRLMRSLSISVIATALVSGVTGCASVQSVCENGVGSDHGNFYSFFRDTGSGCISLGAAGHYATTWDLGRNGNLVAGKGWAEGLASRQIVYNAASFEPGANGYLTLYGWSTDPLVEYYVVENWGDFTPPGSGAVALGTLETDGGTYRIYRTQRVDQPSILGTATFDQFWSIRTSRRSLGVDNVITFKAHVDAWRALGLTLGSMNYQILATEGFGSTGYSEVRVWEINDSPAPGSR